MATRQQRQIVETPTEARQAEPGPSVLALLVVSTGLAVLILGVICSHSSGPEQEIQSGNRSSCAGAGGRFRVGVGIAANSRDHFYFFPLYITGLNGPLRRKAEVRLITCQRTGKGLIFCF